MKNVGRVLSLTSIGVWVLLCGCRAQNARETREIDGSGIIVKYRASQITDALIELQCEIVNNGAEDIWIIDGSPDVPDPTGANQRNAGIYLDEDDRTLVVAGNIGRLGQGGEWAHTIARRTECHTYTFHILRASRRRTGRCEPRSGYRTGSLAVRGSAPNPRGLPLFTNSMIGKQEDRTGTGLSSRQPGRLFVVPCHWPKAINLRRTTASGAHAARQASATACRAAQDGERRGFRGHAGGVLSSYRDSIRFLPLSPRDGS